MLFAFRPAPAKLPLVKTIMADAQRVHKAIIGNESLVRINTGIDRNQAVDLPPKEALAKIREIANRKLSWLRSRNTSEFGEPAKKANTDGIEGLTSLLGEVEREYGPDETPGSPGARKLPRVS